MIKEMSFGALLQYFTIIIQLTANFALSKEVIYVSRVSGNDSSNCGKELTPCRTISYGINQAPEDSYIYLDGTTTAKDPYNCQPLDIQFAGILITKSMSFISVGSRAFISCLHGKQWFVDGTGNKGGIRVGFSGLAFKNTSLRFFDALVNVDDSLFENSNDVVMNIVVFNLTWYDVMINNATFQQNMACISVKSKIETSIRINVTNSRFLENGYSEFSAPVLPSILKLTSNKSRINIQIRSCSFKNNTFRDIGMTYVNNSHGTVTMLLDQSNLEENGNNSAISGIFNGIFYVLSDRVIVNIDFSFIYNTHGTFLTVFSLSSQINISNTEMDGFYSSGKQAGLLDITSSWSGYLSIRGSSFRNGKNNWYGGAVKVIAPASSMTIQNSTFQNISSPRCGGAVYVQSYDYSKSLNQSMYFNAELNIFNSSFSNSISGAGGAVCMVVENVIVNILDSSFVRNTAELSGGALKFIIYDAGTIWFQNVYFIENTAQQEGIVSGKALFRKSAFVFGTKNVWFLRNKIQSSAESVNGILLLITERKIATIVLKQTYFIENYGLNAGTILVSLLKTSRTLSIIILDTCLFRKNVVDSGALAVSGQAKLACENSIFHSNGVLIPCQLPTIYVEMNNSVIIITNCTFVNNLCGALRFRLNKNSRFKTKDSTFIRNKLKDGSGGAMYIAFITSEDKDTNHDMVHRHPRDKHLDNVLIQNVRFQGNVATSGSVLALENGKIAITNCTFVNNFAHVQGGQISSFGSTDTSIFNSVFKQTLPKIIENNTTEFGASSFLVFTSTGRLLIHNTTIDMKTISDRPLIWVSRSKQVKIDNSSTTTCSTGHDLQTTIYIYAGSGKRSYTVLDFSCKKCEYNFYSLQKGHAQGMQANDSFKCIPCPRGADCRPPSIKSKSNFWGYKNGSNSSILTFTLCPFGYCKSPQPHSSAYNECQGKRTGFMCGKCSNGYTEALWSTHCTAIEDCDDHWFWILFLALIFLMAILLLFKPPIIKYSLRQVLWLKRFSRGANPQQYRVISSFSSGGEANEANISRSQFQHEKEQFSRFLDIVFYFYQIAQLLLSSYSLSEFFDTKFLPPLLGFFNFQPSVNKEGFLCPFPGLTPKTKLVFKLAPVFGTMIAIFIIYLFHLLFCRLRKTRRPSIPPYLQASIKTVILGYVTMATVSFSLIRCISIAGKNRWFYNGNVICYQWWQYASFVFNGIFVIPLMFALAWASFKLRHNSITVRQFLLAIIFPLPLLLFWLSRFVCPSREKDVEDGPNLNAIKELLLASYKRPKNKSKYGALYWQSVLIARRFVLVLIFCTVTDPFLRLFCMTLACVFVLYYHVKVKPFRNVLANNLESLSLMLLVILGLINLSKSVFVGNEDNIKGSLITVFNVFQWIEIVILGLFPALCFLLLCLAIVSMALRVLFICSRSLFKFIFRRSFQERIPHNSAQMINVLEEIHN